MNARAAFALESVTKRYGTAAQPVEAVNDVSFSVRCGDFVAMMGPSGCGKSTLLNLIAGLDTPDGGRVMVGGQDIAQLSDGQRSDLRLSHIGFVFQSFQLLPTFTVEENVAWPVEILGPRRRRARERARAALEKTGISRTAFCRLPGELSGGEQQRVAIARAIVTDPTLVLADEPTGNLDSQTGVTILDLLRTLNRTQGTTIFMATHSAVASGYGHRTIDVCDGRIVREYQQPSEVQLRVVERE